MIEEKMDQLKAVKQKIDKGDYDIAPIINLQEPRIQLAGHRYSRVEDKLRHRYFMRFWWYCYMNGGAEEIELTKDSIIRVFLLSKLS